MYNINDLLKNQHIAHRGCWDEKVPENSLEAFQTALEKGLDIELDAHIMKDGNFAVFHDFKLKRMCNKKGFINSLTKNQLSKYNLNNTKHTIPELKEILQIVNGKVTIFLEIKVIFRPLKFAKCLAESLQGYNGAIVLHGLNRKALKYLKEHTEYPIAFLSLYPKRYKNGFSPDALTIRLKALPVPKNKRHLYPPFISWTINSPKDKIKAELYSDAYLTNIKNI